MVLVSIFVHINPSSMCSVVNVTPVAFTFLDLFLILNLGRVDPAAKRNC